MALNRQLFFWLNNLAHRNNILDWLWIFFAQYAVFIFALALIYFLRRDKRAFFKVASATVVTIIIVTLIKKIWPLSRPFLEEKVRLLITHPPDSTFPSKHAAAAFAIAFGIFLEKKCLGTALLFLAFFVALSRVVVGVHYPWDILAGSAIGIAAAYLSHKFLFQKK